MRTVSALMASMFGLLALAAPVTARLGFPEPATEHARTIEDVYVKIMIAGIIAFLIVMALLAWVMIRYRENGGKGRATFEKERDNLKAELAWTLIPLVVVLWVGVISYQALVDLENLDGEEIEYGVVMDITASRYAWQADYDTGVRAVAVANPDLTKIEPFYVPANEPVLFRVTGADVIHSWNVLGLAETIDAVPGQINELLVRDGFPEGEYFTQCKEDCLTPGHSYMQTQVISVSADEYAAWTEGKLAGAAAGLEQLMALDYDGTLGSTASTTLARGAAVTLQFNNMDTAPHTFAVAGESVVVDGESLGVLEIAPSELGTLSVTVDGAAGIDLPVVDPEAVAVDLSDFRITPGTLELEAGGIYVLEVTNNGNVIHNLYVGMSGGDSVTDALWSTRNLANGESHTILVMPTEASTLDMWCAVAGHYGAGMFGTFTVV